MLCVIEAPSSSTLSHLTMADTMLLPWTACLQKGGQDQGPRELPMAIEHLSSSEQPCPPVRSWHTPLEEVHVQCPAETLLTRCGIPVVVVDLSFSAPVKHPWSFASMLWCSMERVRVRCLCTYAHTSRTPRDVPSARTRWVLLAHCAFQIDRVHCLQHIHPSGLQLPFKA